MTLIIPTGGEGGTLNISNSNDRLKLGSQREAERGLLGENIMNPKRSNIV